MPNYPGAKQAPLDGSAFLQVLGFEEQSNPDPNKIPLRCCQAVQRFAVADLSNWYLDVIKDRLYVSAPDSLDRRAAQTVLHALVQVLTVSINS